MVDEDCSVRILLRSSTEYARTGVVLYSMVASPSPAEFRPSYFPFLLASTDAGTCSRLQFHSNNIYNSQFVGCMHRMRYVIGLRLYHSIVYATGMAYAYERSSCHSCMKVRTSPSVCGQSARRHNASAIALSSLTTSLAFVAAATGRVTKNAGMACRTPDSTGNTWCTCTRMLNRHGQGPSACTTRNRTMSIAPRARAH